MRNLPTHPAAASGAELAERLGSVARCQKCVFTRMLKDSMFLALQSWRLIRSWCVRLVPVKLVLRRALTAPSLGAGVQEH